MAKTIGRFAPSEVPNLPASFDSWIATQTGYNDRLGLIPASISPTVLDSIRKEAASGQLGRLYELYEKMVATDARIGGITGSLKATVSGLPLKTVRAETVSAGEVALAEDYRGVIREAHNQMDTHSFVSDLVEPYLIGTKAFQLKWRIEDYPRGKKIAIPNSPAPIPGQSLEWQNTMLDPNWGELKIVEINNAEGTYFKDIDTRRAFVVSDGTAKGRYDTLGALRRTLGWWITKMYAQLWWVEYVESYGQPMRVARYTPESTSRERAQLKSFLSTIGRQKWGLFPQGADIQLLEATQAGNITTFSDIIKVANNEIAVALMGQSGMTQDSAQGSRAKLEVLDGVRIEIVSHVAQIVAKGFKALNDAILRANYGEAYIKRLCPQTKPIVPKPGSNTEKLATYTGLAEAGVPVAVDEIHESMGIPQPEQGMMVLFHGKVVEMTTLQEMEDERQEQNDSLVGQGDLPEGETESGSGSGGSNGRETDQGSDDERKVPSTEKQG